MDDITSLGSTGAADNSAIEVYSTDTTSNATSIKQRDMVVTCLLDMFMCYKEFSSICDGLVFNTTINKSNLDTSTTTTAKETAITVANIREPKSVFAVTNGDEICINGNTLYTIDTLIDIVLQGGQCMVEDGVYTVGNGYAGFALKDIVTGDTTVNTKKEVSAHDIIVYSSIGYDLYGSMLFKSDA
jgi:hypothetical protein